MSRFLEIKDLKVSYKTNGKLVEVVRSVDLDITKSECVGLVGESGCGKTTLGLSITRLIPEHKGFITSGKILLENRDLLALDPEELRKVRGKRISYVFQEVFSSLNPLFTVCEQLKEALPENFAAEEFISKILNNVGLAKIAHNKKIYPHELSGGMQQRVMIAIAIASKPDLVVLDEPTTALDVTVQKRILDLIMALKEEMGLSILFISHDLRIIFKLSDSVAIMYAGKIVEKGPKEKVSSHPCHPYTIALMDSIPSFEHRKERFNAIEGKSPLFSELPEGCKFYSRCKFRIEGCLAKEPEMEELSKRHFSRCIRTKELFLDGVNKDS